MKNLTKKSKIYPTLKELLLTQEKIALAGAPRLTGNCEIKWSQKGVPYSKISSHSAIDATTNADAFTVSVSHFHNCISYKELLLDLLQRDRYVTRVFYRECLIRICYVGGDIDFIPDLYVETEDRSVTLIDVVSIKQSEGLSFSHHQALIRRYCEHNEMNYLCLINHQLKPRIIDL